MRTSSLCVSLDRANRIGIVAKSYATPGNRRSRRGGEGVKETTEMLGASYYLIVGNSALIAGRARK